MPGACQSREAARPQTGESTFPHESASFGLRIFCFAESNELFSVRWLFRRQIACPVTKNKNTLLLVIFTRR